MVVRRKISLELTLSSGFPAGVNTEGKAFLVSDSGRLCVRHPIMKAGVTPNTATWDAKAYMSFANAHSPEALVDFIGRHGYLFEAWASTPDLRTAPYGIPTTAEIMDAFCGFDWSSRHHRALVRGAEKLQRESKKEIGEDTEKGAYLAAPPEPLADWVAARKVFLFAIELYERSIGRKNAPAFTVDIDLAGATRYLEQVKRYCDAHLHIAHGEKGCQQFGFYMADGTTLHYDGGNAQGALSALWEMHVPGGIKLARTSEQRTVFIFRDLLSSLWWQLSENIRNQEIRRCCVSDCGCLHVRTPGSPRYTCSNPCTQKNKEANMKGR